MNVHKSYGLTSPIMRDSGSDRSIHHLQKVLDNKNKWNKDFLKGVIDGAFGSITAAGVKRAKYFLGYSQKVIDSHFGDDYNQVLEDYLMKKKKLTPAMKIRMNRRIKLAKMKPLRSKVLLEMKKYLGLEEYPANSNKVVFTKRWGMVGPWCAMAVSTCAYDCKSITFKLKKYHAYCPTIEGDIRSNRNNLWSISASHVKEGHLVLFGFGHNESVHIGLFVEWIDKDKGFFKTIEANTSLDSDDNGGKVMYRERYVSDVRVFGGYK